VHPYFSNRAKRLIKTPKLYFLDTGLCAYLAGWRDSEQIRMGPWAGAFFETAIFGELVRHFTNRGIDYQIHFWRDKDGREVDFLVETGRKIHPVEVKLGTPNPRELISLEHLNIPEVETGTVVSPTYAPIDGALVVAVKEGWNVSGVHIGKLWSGSS